jgi:hypothetical protein
MTMAHGEGCSGDVVRICNTRLSTNLGREEAGKEFLFYAEGRHPLLERMEAGLRGAILNYLKTFASTVGPDFDFRNGSIGNFILTGACLAHNGDINTAIFVFRKLCGISGNVWPCSLDNDLVLSATLKNGARLAPQDVITRLCDTDAEIGIESIGLAREEGKAPSANPAALEAIERADLIAFGPGSFYTSILPHLLVEGVVAAIDRADCPKIFIGNILQCTETLGMALKDVVAAFGETWRQAGNGKPDSGKAPCLHILGNRLLFPFEKTVGGFAYLADDLPEDGHHDVRLDELEDAWNRGQHDGDLVAERLLAIALLTKSGRKNE